MKMQAGFLVALLFLANALTTTEADEGRVAIYNGNTGAVEGKPWSISCQGWQKEDEIHWTRDDRSLEQEIEDDELTRDTDQTVTTISASAAKTKHDGTYKCLKSASQSHKLTVYPAPNQQAPGNSNRSLHIFDAPTPLLLICANKTATDKVQWYKEGAEVKLGDDVTKESKENGTLEILKYANGIYGNYSCSIANGTTTEFLVVAKPAPHLPDSISVVEGEKLHLVCGAPHHWGVSTVVAWTFGNKKYTETLGRVKISRDEENHIDGAVLDVDNIVMEDRGNITCSVSYKVDMKTEGLIVPGETVTTLRVKDKLAALWPFLGICAEVLVLCAIILIYEKKRNKADLDESDTDQSPDTKPTPNKDSEVRQRK